MPQPRHRGEYPKDWPAIAKAVKPGPLVLVIDIAGLKVTLGQLADDQDGTDQTIGAMLAVIQHAARTKIVRQRAAALATPGGVYDYLKNRLVFEPDPLGIEYIRHPSMVIKLIDTFGRAAGDCDDLAVCACALLKAIGYTPVLAVVSRKAEGERRRYEHVFPGYMPRPGLALTADSVVPMEIQTRVPMGTWPDARIRRLYLATGEHS